MVWINFLHLYQPANLEDYYIKEAAEKSYFRILRALEENPNLKFTLNMSGCLLERLHNLQYNDFFSRVKKLITQGQVELVGSAAYHPILPLIPESEIIAQIKENERIIKKYFGKIRLRGFFFPEMAYSAKAARIIKKLGYEWLILDEASAKAKISENELNDIYTDSASGLKVVFRNRKISNTYIPEYLKNNLSKNNYSQTIITATDGELYGLRHIDHTGEFEKIIKNKSITTETISKYISKNKPAKKISLRNSSWESTEEELKNGNPYALWQNNKNLIHKMLWTLAGLALSTENKFKKDKNNYWSRWHLVRGLASCTFWWASGRDLRKKFGPLAWSPDDIERGINELVRSIRSINNPSAKKYKIQAEKINASLRSLIWETHWK